MADELTISASLDFDDGRGTPVGISVSRILATLATRKKNSQIQTIGTTEEAIQLGEVTTPGYAIFRNLDTTNFVDLRVATGGAKFARLLPDTNGDGSGGIALLYLGPGAQVPFAIADTDACDIEFLICAQ